MREIARNPAAARCFAGIARNGENTRNTACLRGTRVFTRTFAPGQLYEALDDKYIYAQEPEDEVVGLRVELLGFFSSSDSDVSFYTGLLSCAIFFMYFSFH